MEADTRDSARAALHALWRDGSPVVRAHNIEEIVSVGWRRWNSFARRNSRRPSGIDMRVEDLAKGLRDKLEREPSLVGPLIEDYRHLARTLATAFEDAH